MKIYLKSKKIYSFIKHLFTLQATWTKHLGFRSIEQNFLSAIGTIAVSIQKAVLIFLKENGFFSLRLMFGHMEQALVKIDLVGRE